MKPAAIVTVTKNSEAFTVPTTRRGSPPWAKIGGNDRAPAASARAVENTADQPEAADELEVAIGLRTAHATPEQIEADRAELGQHDRPRDGNAEAGENEDADQTTDDAGDDEAPEQTPIDVAMQGMAESDIPLVELSAAWIAAEAEAGGKPSRRRNAAPTTPKAMPSALSMSWAVKPMMMKAAAPRATGPLRGSSHRRAPMFNLRSQGQGDMLFAARQAMQSRWRLP